jgi:hypothetical protein
MWFVSDESALYELYCVWPFSNIQTDRVEGNGRDAMLYFAEEKVTTDFKYKVQYSPYFASIPLVACSNVNTLHVVNCTLYIFLKADGHSLLWYNCYTYVYPCLFSSRQGLDLHRVWRDRVWSTATGWTRYSIESLIDISNTVVHRRRNVTCSCVWSALSTAHRSLMSNVIRQTYVSQYITLHRINTKQEA